MLMKPNINPEIIFHRVIVNLDVLSDQSDITADDNGVYFNGFGRVMHVYLNVNER